MARLAPAAPVPARHDASPVLTSWQRYRLPLKVSGPMPGRPAERGEFVMEVSSTATRPGWWITLDRPAPEP
jgi:hypothetical protein